jgi:hypothetical protein
LTSGARLLVFLNLAAWHGVAIVGVMVHSVPASMVATGVVLFMGRWLHDLADSDDEWDVDDEGGDEDDPEGDAVEA